MKLRLAYALLACVSFMASTMSANAAIYSVHFDFTFSPAEFIVGPVFGETGPSTLSANMTIDTSAAQYTGSNCLTFAYCYDLSSLRDFSATFGTETWGLSDLLPIDNTVAIALNAPLATGVSTGISFQAMNADGLVAVLANPAMPTTQVGQNSTPSYVTNRMTMPTATVSAVPAPASVYLLATGLAGLLSLARRRSARAEPIRVIA